MMRHALSITLALICAAALAGCGGGSGGSQPGIVPGGTPPTTLAPNSIAMTIAIPGAAAASSTKRAQYVSPGTQSIGVVVTNQGATPSPAQFTNISSCPQVSGVTTCTVTVQALPGSDTFTISAYSAANGGGAVLSAGSITSNIVAGQANTTLPVTLSGVISSIAVTPGIATLPLGQSTTLNVVAKDASGAAIVGTYDSPLTLSGANLAFSSTTVTNSNDASHVTIAWKYGFASASASTVSVTADGHTGSVAIAPGTGFAFYQTGTNSATDETGFKMIAGSNGKLYYTSLGPQVCVNSFCTASNGAVHQFDPSTSTDTELDLQSEASGLFFASDGALWIGGGFQPSPGVGPFIFRMAPGQFSSSALTTITVPTPTPAPNGTVPNAFPRTFAQDGAGNLWFVDGPGHRFLKIPVAGPYATSSITPYGLPNGTYRAKSLGIQYVGGVLVAIDSNNGLVDVINPATASVIGQYATNQQAGLSVPGDTDSPWDSTNDGSLAYISETGLYSLTEPIGDLETFNPSTHAFNTLPIVNGPVGVEPGASSINGSTMYFQDLYNGSLELFDLSSNKSRMIPIMGSDGNFFNMPDGVATMPDGTAWFSCYAAAQIFQPLCVGHTIYLSGWSIFPSSSIALYGAGMQSAQIMGIMEAPSANSGPFTETSSNSSVCTIANASDHNFTIVGQSPGACTVTVKDAHNVTSSINVTVTTTAGTVQAKHLGGIK